MKKNQTKENVKPEFSENKENNVQFFELDCDFFVKTDIDGLVKSGDLLCIKKTSTIESGDLVYVYYGSVPYCGYWWELTDCFVLQFSPAFEPLILDSEDIKYIKVIGRVTAVYHPVVNEHKIEYEKFLEKYNLSDDEPADGKPTL